MQGKSDTRDADPADYTRNEVIAELQLREAHRFAFGARRHRTERVHIPVLMNEPSDAQQVLSELRIISRIAGQLSWLYAKIGSRAIDQPIGIGTHSNANDPEE